MANNKQWFQVTMEGLAPVRVNYRVFAHSEENALETVERANGTHPLDGRPQFEIRLLKKKKIVIKNLITGLTKFNKTY